MKNIFKLFILFLIVASFFLFIPIKTANASCAGSGTKKAGEKCSSNDDCCSGKCVDKLVAPRAPSIKACEGDSVEEVGVQKTATKPLPCSVQTVGGKTVYLCKTSLGLDVDTSPQGTIKFFLSLILGVSGGIAVLLIMFAGYQLMLSRANAEKIQEGKDRLASAIIGLLFIIFSLAILQIIGVDILKIPGFTK